ncbi:DUF7739 domain-containing protein [Streptomyces sp. NPDC004778]
MAHHVTISHGSDFFGVDRFSLTELTEIAKCIEECFTTLERGQLPYLLKNAGTGSQTFPVDEAAELAALLRRAARHPRAKFKFAARARLLADAADRAAADGDPWTWSLT